jgi:hypothetical protein
MTADEREFISKQFEAVHQKMDLIINPVKEDVTSLKVKVEGHRDRIIEMEEFKKGHQLHHAEKREKSRFNWELLAGSGILGGFLTWIMKSNG